MADFQLAAVAEGYETPHSPAALPPERQLFSTDYQQARFVAMDHLWHNWAQFNVPGAAAIMADVVQWSLIYFK